MKLEGKLTQLQKEYRKFFKQRLKKFGVRSPAELSPEQKTEFFKDIPPEWVTKKEELAGNGITPKQQATGEYKDRSGTRFILSKFDNGTVELVQLTNASNIITCSLYEFKHNYVPASRFVDPSDSPLNIALIETSEVVATLNTLLKVALRAAPEEIKATALEAIKASKALLQKLAAEIKE